MAQNNQDDFDLDKALDQFDNNQLNLTNEEVKPDLNEDAEMDAKVKQQYEKFMQQMKNLGGSVGGQDQGLDGLTNMLGGLLRNLTSEGLQGDQSQISKGFEQMFKNLKDNNIQQAAGKLLNQFMDKNLLYEPMQQVRQHYEQYFKKQEGKIPAQDGQRYNKQYQILKSIIQTLDKQPENKQKLIELFQKMQQYGNPPEGIASASSFM